MKADDQMQKDLMERLQQVHYLHNSEIAVSVKNGVATLSGHVESYPRRLAAEIAVRKISGVKIIDNIDIAVAPAKCTDAEITLSLYRALKGRPEVRSKQVRMSVENGTVKLEGEVEWGFQRENIQKAIENIAGIGFILNSIIVNPKITPAYIDQKMNAPFQLAANFNAQRIGAKGDSAGDSPGIFKALFN